MIIFGSEQCIERRVRGLSRVRMFNIAPSAVNQRDFSLKHGRDVIRYRRALLSVFPTFDRSVDFVFDNDNCLIYPKLCRVRINLMI